VPHPDTWSATSGYTMAFGQGYSVNALQMVNAYGTICNDGVRIAPRIVAGWRAPDGTFTPAPVGKPTRVVSPATAKTVRTMMEGVLGEGGTAPLARIPGYRVGGKTGTANRYDEKVGRYRGYTMSFMGIAPADAPRFVTAVTLQRPNVGVGGGSTAGPVFKDLTSFALEKKRVPPTGSRSPVIKLTTD
jgi:cell division protein FtsI (penicillin-binding protein 3)